MSGRMCRLAERTFVPGRLDPTKRPGSARWREALPHARVVTIDDVGHFPQEEAPERVTAVIRDASRGPTK